MAEYPALVLWTDAYLADTIDLTAEEHGVYLLLLMAAWRSPDCSLQDDDERLARTARVGAKRWKSVRQTMLKFWSVEGGKWTQKRLLRERLRSDMLRSAKARAGRASALKRQDTASTGVPTERATAGQPPLPSPLPSLRKEERKGRKTDSGPEGPAHPKSRSKEPALPLPGSNVVQIKRPALPDTLPPDSGLDAVAMKDIIFGRALKFLRSRIPNRNDNYLRTWLGKLIRDNGELITLEALRRAQQTLPVEIVSYVEGSCRHMRENGGVRSHGEQASPRAIAGLD